MTLYDVHAHLADPRVRSRAEELVSAARRHGVAGILATAARHDEWGDIVKLSTLSPVVGAVGVHPFFAGEWRPPMVAELQGLAADTPGIRAIGEIGLDAWEGRQDIALQIEALVPQLYVAQQLDLPVIVHNRKSWNEFFKVLDSLGLNTLRGVCHGFNGSRELTRQVLDRGLMVSFGGPITYDNASRLRAAAAYVPLDRLFTETDCPDLPAQEVRPGPSLPQHVRYTLDAIARARGERVETIAEHVGENYRRLLGIA